MYAPEGVLTNDDLAEIVDTSDEWIRSRTGIERRHVAGTHESTSQMAIEAAHAALRVADANPRDIDLIIVGTSTPNHIFPSTACQVQDALGAVKAGAFDMNAGCSGFVYALAMGQQSIASGEHDLVLVIGADTLSRTVNWKDRSTCILFGDGAGAVLLRAGENGAGVLATLLGSDGSGGDLLMIPAGGAAMPACRRTVDDELHFIQMNGKEVYRFATRTMPQAVEQIAKKAGWELEDIDLIIPHQANLRIIAMAAKRLKLPMERFAVNLEEYGNTSAGSVPIALCESIEKGQVGPGHKVVMVGFGAGLTWAAVALQWSIPPEEATSPAWRIWWRWLLYSWARARTRLRQTSRRTTVKLIRLADRIGRRNGDR
jgi:3-oxoacyl-[acyl-carrier-protein] synthase-3